MKFDSRPSSPESLKTFALTRVVSDMDIDEMGHVNNVVYISWMHEVAVAHAAFLGWTAERHRKDGLGWVVRKHQINYHRPAFAGESIKVRTWIRGFTMAGCSRQFEVCRIGESEECLVTAATDYAMINLATGRPTRIPEGVAQSFNALAQ